MSNSVISYHFLGDITSYRFEQQCLDLRCGAALVRVEVLAPDLMRVRLAPDGEFDHGFSYAVARTEWPAAEATFLAGDDALELRSAALTCRVQRSPCRLSFYDPMGRLLAADADGLGWGDALVGDRPVVCRQRLLPGSHFYGLGEKAFPMERRGRRFELYNTDPACYQLYDDPINQSVPFFLGLVPLESTGSGGRGGGATGAYGVLLDNPARSFFDFGHTEGDVLSFEAKAGELRYYLMAAPKLQDVLETYVDLTGRMALPPLWALGFHQARWSYPDEETVRELAAQFRRRSIPCDAVYLDIDYMDGYRCFTWNRDAFPSHRQMIADLRADGIRTVAIIDAGVKVDPGYAVHDDGLARDAFLRNAGGSLFVGPVWPGDCYFPDFTDPAVRAWWGELYAGLLDDGVAGFWNDMNEPALFDDVVLPDDAPCHLDGHGATHRQMHNAYGTQMARATAEGLARLRPNWRHLVISRAAFAGHQRHAMVWTGDNFSTWEHLRLTVTMGLSLGLSGIAFHGADVGGFAGDCTGELLARWTQLGAFTPFFRNHAALGTVDQEPWAFGEGIEAICRRAIELRYELLPAIYTAFWESWQTGVPIMRPLVLGHQYDPRVATLDDQFKLGGDLLVAPVLEPGVHGRNVYLPAGQWYDFWSGEKLGGGRDLWVHAPLDTIPLFVKAGTVLPMQPVQQHTDEPPAEAVTLRVYPGIGESLWYEDDGQTLAYQAGEFRLTRFAVRGDDTWVQVTAACEGPFPSPRQRWAWQIYGLAGAPDSVEVDGETVVDWRHDPASHILHVETAPCQRLAVRVPPSSYNLP
jgi:alpha-glucosidase